MKKYLLCDAEETIIHTPMHYEILRVVLDKYGIKKSTEDVKNIRNFFSYLDKIHIDNKEFWKEYSSYDTLKTRKDYMNKGEFSLFPDSVEFLKYLKSKNLNELRRAIVTDTPKEKTKLSIAFFGLNEYFPVFSCAPNSSDCLKSRAPHVIENALNLMDYNCDGEIIIADDSGIVKDMGDIARTLTGIEPTTVHVNRNGSSGVESDYSIRSLTELIDLLERH